MTIAPAELCAMAAGLATLDDGGAVLDVWYPRARLEREDAESKTVRLSSESARSFLGDIALSALGRNSKRRVEIVAVGTTIANLARPPIDAYDVYMRLHLLSMRLVRPRTVNLDGMFGLLTNVAWTSLGPCLPNDVEALRWQARAAGITLQVTSVDKIPRMTDYVIPQGIRIADADRVRLGAYLSPGTTVMHEGFCNFNAGTLGVSMVEGRISAGVLIGDGTDIGGGASIMGTLSGGGCQVISLGENCLLGANSGLGISLGDRCLVEAGCYVTAGTRVRLPSDEIVKAAALSGHSDLLFRRHSQTGVVEAIARKGKWAGLNPTLHTLD